MRRKIGVKYINGYLGLRLPPEKIADLLSRMALAAKPVDGGEAVEVEVPPTRSDVLQDVDVVEVSCLFWCIEQPDLPDLPSAPHSAL